MSKAKRKKKSGNDVLRAADMIPPYNKRTSRKKVSRKKQKSTAKTASSVKKQKKTSKIKTTKAAKKKTSGKSASLNKSEIPKFDLADEIMAEHRKVTAARRKGPGEKHKAPVKERDIKPVAHNIERLKPVFLEESQIISEIVARDIEKLCGGNG